MHLSPHQTACLQAMGITLYEYHGPIPDEDHIDVEHIDVERNDAKHDTKSEPAVSVNDAVDQNAVSDKQTENVVTENDFAWLAHLRKYLGEETMIVSREVEVPIYDKESSQLILPVSRSLTDAVLKKHIWSVIQ